MNRTVLSSNQYTMLKLFAAQPVQGGGFSEEQAGALVQTTFGSMLHNKWVFWNGRKFTITNKGREAIKTFDRADLMRKVASLNLTKYWVRPAGLKRPVLIDHGGDTRLRRVS